MSRLGGDEFGILLSGADADAAALVAQKLLDAAQAPFYIEQHVLHVTASLGIAMFPEDGGSFEALSKNADTAMYRAKQEGRNGYCFFTSEMQTRSSRNWRLTNDLESALAAGQMYLVYQPLLDLEHGTLYGAEVLLRWKHPELGDISPAEFIQVAEECGQIIPIGEWVLRGALQQLRAWHAEGEHGLVLAVNLSAAQFAHGDLTDMVDSLLQEYGVPATCLELELTEGVAMRDPQRAIAIMDALHARGIKLSFDDFGTGYSSLAYLKRFKLDKLKIDRSFVNDIQTDEEDRAIVRTIINMSRSLGLKTLAEGVETQEQRTFLLENGCNQVQGYLYSKPLLPVAFADFARKQRALIA